MSFSVLLVAALFVLGLLLIIKGGDLFVDAAAWIAEVSGIPKLIIGATVVSFATTLPEMLVSIFAAVDGKVDMSIGNAVGSVTANLGLIMAISVLFMPAVIRRMDYLAKSLIMLAAAAVIVIGGLRGQLSVFSYVLLLIIFSIFMYDNVSAAVIASRHTVERKRARPEGREVFSNILKFILGTVGIVVGAQLLVDNGSELARLIGISERIIGVTLVAVGTSLPELVTTITSIVKKQSSLSVGNILGANILDLTLILPLSGVISGQTLPISPLSASIDLPVCLLVGVIAVVPPLFSQKFSRWQGVALLAVYAVYLVFTCLM